MAIDHKKTLFDTTLCATYYELVFTNPKAPYVIGTQVLVDTTCGVALVNAIASSTGD
jgi:hypothetical protein